MEDLKDDEKLGAKIVLKALEEPVKQIAVNAGLEPAVILEKVKQSPVGTGFNAKDEVYVDMKKAGIVDPTKVSRSALQNAASVASMVLTTESIVTDKKSQKNAIAHMMMQQLAWVECIKNGFNNKRSDCLLRGNRFLVHKTS